MKKKILLFILLFVPFMINAEEKCNIISGNGQDIGSEIACGTEHFYIIENKEDSVRMLAKYNLYTGQIYNEVTLSAERYTEITELCNGGSYCDSMFEEPEFTGYTYVNRNYDNDDGTHTYFVYAVIDEEEIKQDKKAIGAHGDSKDKPVYPEYGVITNSYYKIGTSSENLFGDPYGNKTFIDYNIDESDFTNDNYTSFYDMLNSYNSYMDNKGFELLNFDMLSVKDLDNVIYKLTNQRLPLEDWANEDWEKDKSKADNFYIVGSIKEYIPTGYEWLYGTTYWTRTTIPYYNSSGSLDRADSTLNVYFIATLGNLCNAFGCEDAIGAGVRPVVEISKDIINYNLTTETNNNGTLETTTELKTGDTIVLNATPKKGYKLEKLIVKTESGTTIEVSGEDIIENEDGTISINPDVFTMPLENVVVEAKWQIINPKTGVSSYIGLIFTLLLVSVSAFYCLRTYNNSYEL